MGEAHPRGVVQRAGTNRKNRFFVGTTMTLMHELTDLLHGSRLRTTGQRVENKKTEAEGVTRD